MSCAYSSTFRAGQPWDKPGHDDKGSKAQIGKDLTNSNRYKRRFLFSVYQN